MTEACQHTQTNGTAYTGNVLYAVYTHNLQTHWRADAVESDNVTTGTCVDRNGTRNNNCTTDTTVIVLTADSYEQHAPCCGDGVEAAMRA